MTGLGKVTNFLQDHVVPALMDFDALDTGEQKEAVQEILDMQRKHDEADASDLRYRTKISK